MARRPNFMSPAVRAALTAQVSAQIGQTERVQREMRRPKHTHYVEHRPWQIQPFMIAPVLPGETMKNINFQCRVVTDPLAVGPGNLVPWWAEHWFFYVKLRDLDIRDDIEGMMLKGESIVAHNTAAEAATFHNGAGINWTKMCLKRIVEEYFRDEGEQWDSDVIGQLPVQHAYKRGTSWVQSLASADAIAALVEEPQQDSSYPVADPAYLAQYEAMRAMGTINVEMTFEDWLGTFGIRGPDAVEAHKPELIRHLSQWTYPNNVIDPTTGAPSGAAVWSVASNINNDRFFSEPGFIVGVTSVRPKVYLGNQKSAGVRMLDDWMSWMPALMRDQPHTSVKKLIGAGGPLANQDADGYWVDARDLFLYGDQFVAGTLGGYAPALPDASSDYRYATAAMADALFAAPAKNLIRQEGVSGLHILGHPTTATDMT